MRLQRGQLGEQAMRGVREAGGRTTGRLSVINGFGARLSAADAVALSRRRDVRAVTLDARVEPQDVRASDIDTAYPFSTGAADAWNKDYKVGQERRRRGHRYRDRRQTP